MAITLGLTTTTTVGMIDLVHRHTTDRGTDTKPSAATSLAQLAIPMVNVARNTNSSTGIFADAANLATLQTDFHIFASHDFAAIIPRLFVLVDDDSVGPCTAAEHGAARGGRANGKHRRANRHHVQREAVALESCFGRQDTRVDNASHAGQELRWDTGTIAVHNVASPQSVRGKDIGLFARGLLGQQRNVRAAAWIVFDSVHQVRPRDLALKVDIAQSPFRTSSAVAHRYPSRRVTSTS